MVSKVDNKNKNNNEYKDFSDESDSEVDNGFSGFNLIPDKYDSDEESVYSENNNVGYEVTPDGDTYEEYIKKEESTITTTTNNADGGDNDADENEFGEFGGFVDFKDHSEQFHNLDGFDNTSSNDNNIEEKLKSNPMLRGIDFSEYFPKSDNDPFSSNNDDLAIDNSNSNNNNNSSSGSVYSERNEKGHMVLERNKLFPPDHVAVIQECMKNIKLDYKPMWTNFLPEDKWMGALKNKLSPTTSSSTNSSTITSTTNISTNTPANTSTNTSTNTLANTSTNTSTNI